VAIYQRECDFKKRVLPFFESIYLAALNRIKMRKLIRMKYINVRNHAVNKIHHL